MRQVNTSSEVEMLTRRNVVEMGLVLGAAGAGFYPSTATRAQSASYTPTTVANGGSIDGVVRFRGNAPEADKVIIGKDNHVCGQGHAPQDPVTLSADNGLRDAVVWIKDIKGGKAWPKRDRYEIVQEKCAFRPYV